MDPTVELYWSFRSPYSYIVLPRMLGLRDRYRVTVDLRVVHPSAIRNPAYFARMDPQARPYFLLDSKRAAEFHGLPFRRPVPDPIDQDPKTLAIAPAQPLARRLSRLGIAACEKGSGLEFAFELGDLLWNGRTDNWHEGDHLAQAARRAGLDLAVLEATVAADPEGYEAKLAANDAALRKAGHWGVPTMVVDGEPFFGQDRFEDLVWRLKQRGLASR